MNDDQKITVMFFATLKDLAGTNQISLPLSVGLSTLNDLRKVLSRDYPQLAAHLSSSVAAINQEFAFPGDPIKAGDEVAFFPPVSGGQSWPEIYRITPDAIDLDDLTRQITAPATGAVCIFTGMVRGETNADGTLVQTARLEYEAYESMAVAKMQQVASEIRERWPLVQGMALVQRIGKLDVGTPTVLIACASAHRDQGCFDAARYGIDRLKEIVPIWKKEVGPNGESWIEGDYVPKPGE